MRTSAEITIKRRESYRPYPSSHIRYRVVDVISVPITPDNRRVWKLMNEDSLTLVFRLAEPTNFYIGDFVEDELFGSFVITEEPAMASYEEKTGVYKYELRFDRDYIGWKNISFLMTHRDTDGSLKRVETEWVLTDVLEAHIKELITNVNEFAVENFDDFRQNRAYRYCIDGVNVGVYDFSNHIVSETKKVLPASYQYEGISESNRKRMSYITYSGANIYQALNDSLSKVYNCDWWVLENVYLAGDDTSIPAIPILCMGKCEFNDTMYFCATDDVSGGGMPNVEKISPSRNSSNYANRLYVYGATTNIPDTYNKSLIFNCTNKRTSPITLFKDSTRNMQERYLVSNYPDAKCNFEGGGSLLPPSTSTGPYWYEMGGAKLSNVYDTFKIKFKFDPHCVIDGTVIDSTIKYELIIDCVSGSWSHQYTTERITENWTLYIDAIEHEFTVSTANTLTNVSIAATLRVWVNQSYVTINGIDLEYGIASSEYPTNRTYNCKLRYNEMLYNIRFQRAASGVTYEWFTFVDSIPAGFDVGSSYEILPANEPEYDGLDYNKVPSSWFSNQFGDINSMRLTGEQRLLLPDGMMCLDSDNYSPTVVPRIEKVVVFDDIYPKCGLRIIAVKKQEGRVKVREYADGSVEYQDGTSYYIAVKMMTIGSDGNENDIAFDWQPQMRLEGEGLKIKFLTRDEELKYCGNPTATGQYMLSGLTFEVGLTSTNELIEFTTEDAYGEDHKYYGFIIAWNHEYGAQLPNASRYPCVGDTLVLSGWNTKYMDELGIIKAAENELKEQGELYLDAIEQEQFTFSCSMMSDWARANGMLPMGQRARVFHGALPIQENGQRYKESRVIGFEYKMDIPEDTPIYTIGETEAYSRLKQLEDALKAQSQSSVSGAIVATSAYTGGGGGGEITVDAYLSNSSTNPVQNKIVKGAIDNLQGQIDNIGRITVDSALSDSSTNPVQNKVITNALNDIEAGDGEWYNIKAGKGSNGLFTIIENYDSKLNDNSQYRMLLLRWRKGTTSGRFASWHAPFFARSGSVNAIAEIDRWWGISSNVQTMFAMSGNYFDDVLPLTIKQRSYDNKFAFRNTSNRKMRFGCAIYKLEDGAWIRKSNIAEYELYAKGLNSYSLSIRK